ncbi:MAG: hypothetical protein U0T84_02990 [Chitinophagales bacterium]
MNWFQIVSLNYRSQPGVLLMDVKGGCELVSDCIFELSFTTMNFSTNEPISL